MSDPRDEMNGVDQGPPDATTTGRMAPPWCATKDDSRGAIAAGHGAEAGGALERIAEDLSGREAAISSASPGVSGALLVEMAEIYAMALLRDCPFSEFATAPTARAIAGGLAALEPLCGREGLDQIPANLFRGPVPGARVGPHLSQLMLTANRATTPLNGEQRDRRLATPRDLAAFVHLDDPCQVYVDAALVMVAGGALLDCGLPDALRHPTRAAFLDSGCAQLLDVLTDLASRVLTAVQQNAARSRPTGRPEQLAAMVTLAANGQGARLGDQAETVGALTRALEGVACGGAGLMRRIADQNAAQAAGRRGAQGGCGDNADELNYLLPRPFADDAPLHPSYAAGHATMAGACVTILKAIFEMSPVRENWSGGGSPVGPGAAVCTLTEARYWEDRVIDRVVAPGPDGFRLEPVDDVVLTVRGELDKLAANIATARTIAGAQFPSDGLQGLRLGERMAAGIIEEQMLTSEEPSRLRLTSFDGDRLIFSTEGRAGPADAPPVSVMVSPAEGGRSGRWGAESYDSWLHRYAPATANGAAGPAGAARFNPAGSPPAVRRPAG